MGSLTPGATYIYERVNGITYARESGSAPSTRKPIGWDYDPVSGHKMPDKVFGVPMPVVAELVAIHQAAQTNPGIQQALEHATMLHRLSKSYE